MFYFLTQKLDSSVTLFILLGITQCSLSLLMAGFT